jgi:hypothetical protein
MFVSVKVAEYGIILVIMRQLHKSRDLYYYPIETYMDIIFIRSMHPKISYIACI